ncbi:hypothetical protein [Zavarzinia sp. CC-PAN008]|uniref:hypothetical protein n=1 Tax=Zavarzinia sp. CC-PAN008 TaxID=3243332 RepID=UPI003F74A5B3
MSASAVQSTTAGLALRLLVLGMAVAGATPALAGDQNQIFLRQESPANPSQGNVLVVDQSAALGASVAGPSQSLLDAVDGAGGSGVAGLPSLLGLPGDAPALQRGVGNDATVIQTGAGANVMLLQQNMADIGVPATGLTGQQARVEAASGAAGAVVQRGDANEARLVLEQQATGLVAQTGTELKADLSVGPGGTGQIIQNGSNIDSGPVVVTTGGSVIYVQNGTNIQPIGATGLNVISSTNIGAIAITQTGY